MPEYAVEARGLVKRFGDFTAVDGVSFSIPPGTIYGFLGPNGAGKSTTIRMLCGILAPTEGEARVAGYDVARNPEAVKASIGYMSQRFSLYRDLTVGENIRFFGGVYGVPPRLLREREDWILEMAGLKGAERRLTAELSAGWRQRLALGCALIHQPPVVFLDEPTAGVDPSSRRDFWEFIYGMAREGITVCVTTHYMDEAEQCHTLSLIYGGRLVAEGTPALLKGERAGGQLLEIRCQPIMPAFEALARVPEVADAALFGTAFHVTVSDVAAAQPVLEEALRSAGIQVSSIRGIAPTLEDVFVSVIHEEERRGELS